MKHGMKLFPVLDVVAVSTADPSSAAQPGRTIDPNGFSCEERRNSNRFGKKNRFACE
jgi:hypothetical protein